MKTILMIQLLMCTSAMADTSGVGKIVGTIGLVEGKVLVDSKPVNKNSPVREGATIDVASASRATLILGKGSVFKLSADSKMLVTQYGVQESDKSENAQLELKFGRTRALILNQGERRDIKIKARAATMGVRGTEIFIDAPKEMKQPVQFFTIEGKADVFTVPGAKPIPLAQNQGLSANGSVGGGSGEARTPSLNVAQVKEAIKNDGLEGSGPKPGAPPPPPAGAGHGLAGNLSDHIGVGALPPLPIDVLQLNSRGLTITPHFCNATTGVCP